MSFGAEPGRRGMRTPRSEVIARRGSGTAPAGRTPDLEPIPWTRVDADLRRGEATCWLSAPTRRGVHTRPVFAAWTGESFVVASNAAAVKTRHLGTGGRCSLALGPSGAHLVFEVEPHRLTRREDLATAVTAFSEVYQWPTRIAGEERDAPYAAPTSGGPPFRVYELVPVRGHAFPTEDGFAPTRFLF
jgi:hypothetical protein